MGRLQRAIYRELIDIYYDTEKPLPLDREKLYDAIGAESEEDQRFVEKLLRFKFEEQADGFHHEICDRVIAEYRLKADVAKANGKLGGRPRIADLNQKEPTGFSVGSNPVSKENPEETGSKANQEPITKNQEPRTKNQEEKQRKVKNTVPQSETMEVFDYWKLKMNHPKAQLDAKREKAIKARLKDGYTVGQLCCAVDGCKYDPFSQGANKDCTVYDDIELICRDGPHVDKFSRIANKGPPSGLSAGLQQQVDILQDWINEGG